MRTKVHRLSLISAYYVTLLRFLAFQITMFAQRHLDMLWGCVLQKQVSNWNEALWDSYYRKQGVKIPSSFVTRINTSHKSDSVFKRTEEQAIQRYVKKKNLFQNLRTELFVETMFPPAALEWFPIQFFFEDWHQLWNAQNKLRWLQIYQPWKNFNFRSLIGLTVME